MRAASKSEEDPFEVNVQDFYHFYVPHGLKML